VQKNNITNINNMNKAEIIGKVTPLVEKAAEGVGLQLLEVDFVNEFDKWHLQVFIYNPEHPVTHEDCQKVTSALDEILDLIIPVPFYLEVSSPGTERKLKSPKEYEIFKGSRVKVKLKKPLDNDLKELKIFFGVILDYDKERGLKIKPEEGTVEVIEVIEIKENNISQIKLEPKYK